MREAGTEDVMEDGMEDGKMEDGVWGLRLMLRILVYYIMATRSTSLHPSM